MSANLKALATALYGNQVQEIENAMRQLLYGFDIDQSVGDQLDVIGAIVGQDRLGKSDENYRIDIKIKIGINTSEGLTEQLIAIWRLLAPGANVTIEEDFPAKIDLTTDTFTGTAAQLIYIKEKLQEALAGGVGFNQIIIADPTKFGFGSTMGPFGSVWAVSA